MAAKLSRKSKSPQKSKHGSSFNASPNRSNRSKTQQKGDVYIDHLIKKGDLKEGGEQEESKEEVKEEPFRPPALLLVSTNRRTRSNSPSFRAQNSSPSKNADSTPMSSRRRDSSRKVLIVKHQKAFKRSTDKLTQEQFTLSEDFYAMAFLSYKKDVVFKHSVSAQ